MLNSKDSLENKFLENIANYHLCQSGTKVLISVSGGPDSICLLELFSLFHEKLQIGIVAFHLNHKLRGEEANQDALFVKNICQKKKIQFILEEVEIEKFCQENKLSVQDGARKVRYQLLRETANEVGAERIALGHNLDDLAETILINILRGTGLTGLVSLKPKRGIIIRPLLNVERTEIESYLQEQKIGYRFDSSNIERKYKRNYIRQEVVPKLIELNPSFLKNCWRLFEVLAQEEELLSKQAKCELEKQGNFDGDYLFISVEVLKVLEKPIFNRVIREAIRKVKGDLMGVELKHILLIRELVELENGASLNLPGEIIVFKKYDQIGFGPFEEPFSEIKPIKLNCPGENYIQEFDLQIECQKVSRQEIKYGDPQIAYLDFNKVNIPLYIRNRLPGDRFIPLGMEGTKKIQDLFVDLKIPKHQRDMIPIITDKNDIVWVVGLRVSEKVKIEEGTKDILKIECR